MRPALPPTPSWAPRWSPLTRYGPARPCSVRVGPSRASHSRGPSFEATTSRQDDRPAHAAATRALEFGLARRQLMRRSRGGELGARNLLRRSLQVVIELALVRGHEPEQQPIRE